MSSLADLRLAPLGARTTPTLNAARNDTGRTAFCGPVVVSAITGYPVSKVEAAVHAARGGTADPDAIVKGTYAEEVADALSVFGYRMTLAEDYHDVERKARPTVWSWMQKPRNAWANYILGIHKGREGHWILIRGVKMCDTFTGGQWTFVCDGPHRGARIMEVFAVRKDHEHVHNARD